MDKVFFEELELPQPTVNLGIGSGTHGDMTGRMMIALEKELLALAPDVVLVQGDTNTVMAGALVATKLSIPVGHVEACLRSYDRTMPEEINRIVTDHISTWLYCPTEAQQAIGRAEGIAEEKLLVTGNTVVDAVYQTLPIAERSSDFLEREALEPKKYILATCHRPATTDTKELLSNVVEYLSVLAQEYAVPVVFPIHPRTKKMLEQFQIAVPEHLRLREPIGYLDMLLAQKNALFVATDSGGLQEESCILQTKCVVLRENTERPEAVDVGGCVLVGVEDLAGMLAQTRVLLEKEVAWYCPFGDGNASEYILDSICSKNA